MSIEQIVVLAIVQGVTEFLPISSSGHLILVPALTGWQDQGLATDIMVHVGSLFAILVDFWRDVLQLIAGGFELVRLQWTDRSKLAAFILLATIPAVIFGLILKSTGLADEMRGIKLIAWNAIIYGLVMLVADRVGSSLRQMKDMTLVSAVSIGLAQALALIPGTSRSGITISAARFLVFGRAEAARFSFLLGIPAIAGAGLLTALGDGAQGALSTDALLAAAFTFLSALASIAFLMALLRRITLLPFVLYRFMLGGFLLVLAYT